MPLQNRVDPFGAIHAVPERGLFTGNRGIIHDPETKTLLKKRWALPAWIICVCEFRNVRRQPMGRNRPGGKAGWTELFFLDEVTGLAAGHRPCFFCRRERASDFVARFGQAFGIDQPRAPMVDKRLHKERLAAGGRAPVVTVPELGGLPDGTMIAEGGTAYALRAGKALRWSFAGYAGAIAFDRLAGLPLRLLTPVTTIAVLRQGFSPVWHPTTET
ncbi:hypothetical protein FJ987_17610 [Mesorhizobium sp. CU2]|uniref:hypothetical protein n=1 Tax=unclassified Mesorhizobium TaxID=325217 RepID=UPI001125B3E4|nr:MULTISPECIES: hypothetical protein [unclassified Mesorhizobium]TPN80534.1 hypothetical protein FJ988_22040 [Mesorhizobium sp. CU3]TPO11953.1 hypothetical protein FJ987_17610 [Mesorhizobium sp. CU2]